MVQRRQWVLCVCMCHQCIKYWSAGKQKSRKIAYTDKSYQPIRGQVSIPWDWKVIRKLLPLVLFPLKRVKMEVINKCHWWCHIPGSPEAFWSVQIWMFQVHIPFLLSTHPFVAPVFFKSLSLLDSGVFRTRSLETFYWLRVASDSVWSDFIVRWQSTAFNCFGQIGLPY